MALNMSDDQVQQIFRVTTAMEADFADHVWSIGGIVGLLDLEG
jgi:hypothetical protein